MQTPDNLLRFPDGKAVSQIKKEAKRLKKTSDLSHSQVLRQLAKDSGIDLPWEKALKQLRSYWDSHFAEFIFQEEPEWDFTVLIGGFDTEEAALAYAKGDGSLRWSYGMLMFRHNGDDNSDWRKLDEREIVIKQQKPETLGNMTVYPQDFEEVKFRSHEFPQVVGRQVTSFGSLAYGVSKSPLIQESPFVEKGSNNTESSKYLEAIGLATRAKQFGHSIYKITHRGSSGQHHYIHTSLEPRFITFMLHFKNVLPTKQELDLSVSRSIFAITHVESFDLQKDTHLFELFNGVSCFSLDLDSLPPMAERGEFAEFQWRVVRIMLQVQAALGIEITEAQLWLDMPNFSKVIDKLQSQGTHSELVEQAKGILGHDRAYFNTLMASLMPSMGVYSSLLKPITL
ncbi:MULTISPECIES: hypothetical protein [Vibrio]|uniref:hypothetical protein n=1 Tax=Vibrio TaxID=662 RepID=UPI000841A7C6|nr:MULTISPECIES: hypothetical protein [Vibrio]ODM56877.1 hypothetical protein BC455_18630 [Vibrio harveyi]USD58481.1 hypothetical protein J4N44_27700 [Vibrio sp. SCSIO 43155]